MEQKLNPHSDTEQDRLRARDDDSDLDDDGELDPETYPIPDWLAEAWDELEAAAEE